MLNLDTHILLFLLTDELTPRERELLLDQPLSISAISLWEIAKLSTLGRIDQDLEHPPLVEALRRIHIWPITLDVCRAIRQLDFRSDPADELIGATSLVHDVPLVTRDRSLLQSKVIRLAT